MLFSPETLLRLVVMITICSSMLWKRVNGQSSIRILDSAPMGKLLGQAIRLNELPDPLQKSQLLTYVLMTGNKGVEYFRIDPHKAQLYANKSIDRDTICDEASLCCDGNVLCTIKIQVAIRGEVGMIPHPIVITVQIEDSNDNTPQFPTPVMHLHIPESAPVGAQYPLKMAKDIDSIDNSVRRYVASFHPPSVFKLVTKPRDSPLVITGLFLEVSQHLDREKESVYTFQVRAIDGGRPHKTGTMTVSVIITDVNDNGPRFKQDIYQFKVNEGLPISRNPVLQLEATDSDDGKNAEVCYDFGPELNKKDTLSYFRLDKSTGNIYLRKPLDYETNPRPNFTVIAMDAQGHASTATATVKVLVVNINDEKPTITIDYLNDMNYVEIPENLNTDRFVAFLTVRDSDADNYGQVSCKLATHQTHYLINEQKLLSDNSVQYRIMTKMSLDREEEAKQSVLIQCEDHGEPHNTATAMLNIHVIDENDCTPKLSVIGNPEVLENQRAGWPVVRIKAVDRDSGINGNVTFSIDSSDIQTRDMLRIDAITGQVYTRHSIDREATEPPIEKLLITVVATDHGKQPRSSSETFIIHIKDVNDNEPYFPHNPIHFSVSENEKKHYQLGQIHVTDPDKNDHLSLRMDISYSQRSVPFTIYKRDRTFFLNTTQTLDREVAGEYNFQVIATDGRHGTGAHTSTANITVTVIDENDHAPEIIFPRESNNTIYISYKEWKNYELLTVNANDRDKDAHNGKFLFDLIYDSNGDGESISPIFEIDANSGTIRVRRPMTSRDIGEHWITVQVRDQGTPSRTASIRCRIVVDRSKPHNRAPPPGGNDSHTTSPENEETALIFVLVFVLVLLLGIIMLFIYIRHWRNAFKFFPDLLVLCDKRSRSSADRSRAKSPERFTASSKSPDPDICVDYMSPPPLCGTMSRAELVKLDKQEQQRRGKIYSEYYMATGRPGSRTLPFKSVNYEVVENMDQSQGRMCQDLDPTRSLKRPPMHDDRQRYDLLAAHAHQQYPGGAGQSRAPPADHFYQTLNLYDDARLPPAARHAHQLSSPVDMFPAAEKHHLQQQRTNYPGGGGGGGGANVRLSSHFKSDPMLNVNKYGGPASEAFIDGKQGGNADKYENIAKQRHHGTLTPGPTRFDRYAMGRLVFDLNTDKDEYAVSFPKVQASFV